MINYIIVDDEPLAHELIINFCDMLPHLNHKKSCYDAIEAMQFLNSEKVDLMFLDINMPKLSGFDFLRALAYPPKVIVSSAYQEYALEGFELNVSDYLLKPFSFDRFVKAINKALADTNSISTQNVSQLSRDDSSTQVNFFVKGDKKYHQIVSSQLLFIEAYGNYTKLFVGEEMIICHESISHFVDLLPDAQFLRVHKSFIVATSKIKMIEGNRIFIKNHTIPIGQTYRSKINDLLNR